MKPSAALGAVALAASVLSFSPAAHSQVPDAAAPSATAPAPLPGTAPAPAPLPATGPAGGPATAPMTEPATTPAPLPASTPAAAPDLGIDYETIIKDIAAANVKRLRRGIVLGPRLGAAGIYQTESGQPDAELAAGFVFYRLRVPFTFEVYQSVLERAKSLAKERIFQLVKEGRPPTVEEAKQLFLTLYREAEGELLRGEGRHDRTFEKPAWGIALEGAWVPREGAGRIRIAPSIGVWHFVIGPTLAAHLRGNPTILLGGELSLRGLASDGPKPKVYEGFLRLEAPSVNRGYYGLYWTAGARVTFDLL